MSAAENDLEHFYGVLKGGITVGGFLDQYSLLMQARNKSEIHEYRLAKGRWKKLSDEITPAAIFARFHAASEDHIQFRLDDGAWDCSIQHGKGRHRRIQITVMQAHERFHLMTALNKNGHSPGFLGLADDNASRVFRTALASERRAYSTEQAQEIFIHNLRLRLDRKRSDSASDTLLVSAPLEILPAQRWQEMRPAMCEVAAGSPYSEIFIVGFGSSGELCIQIAAPLAAIHAPPS